eukprot:gb/GECG01005715.1/.p1 GENE.gb/GECG01005715.1/~~gb/GECG01005715.1/.p1  ORF type:complete len:462 (+),score=57.82 gb/GECG01005715.1/:1-1386(+)
MGNRLFRPNHRCDDGGSSGRTRTASGHATSSRRRGPSRSLRHSQEVQEGPRRDLEYYVQRFEGKSSDEIRDEQRRQSGKNDQNSSRSRANTAPAVPSVEHFSSPTGVHNHYKWSSTVMRTLVARLKVCPMFPASDEIEIDTERNTKGSLESDYDFCSEFSSAKETPSSDCKGVACSPDKEGAEGNNISISEASAAQTSSSDISVTQSVSTASVSAMTPEQKKSSFGESLSEQKAKGPRGGLSKIQEIECPVCFNDYPCELNVTSCCNQEICTECFFSLQNMEFNSSCPFCSTEHFRTCFKAHSSAKETAKFLSKNMKNVKRNEFTTPDLSSLTRSVSERQALAHQISEQNESQLWRSTFNLPPAASSTPMPDEGRPNRTATTPAHLQALRALYGSGSSSSMRAIQERELAVMEELMLYEAMRRSLDEGGNEENDGSGGSEVSTTQATTATSTSQSSATSHS